jgi:hypothetical protein
LQRQQTAILGDKLEQMEKALKKLTPEEGEKDGPKG